MIYQINTKKIMKLIYLILIFFNSIRNIKTNDESSGEYLQNVMLQLQEFNVPSSINNYDRLSSNNNYKNVIYMNEDRQNHKIQKINMNMNIRRNTQKHQNHSFQQYDILFNKKIDLDVPHYYESHVSTKVREPELLGFTKTELAAMYKNALEKGSTINLSSLTNALSSGEIPQISQTHVEFPVKQPLYEYYFFPLKTFISELKKNHDYKTISIPAFDNTKVAQTQTQLSNPFIVAISTFVTIAIIFMMSVLFLPKFTQLDVLPERNIQDDFFYLTNIVTNATERNHFLDKFISHYINSVK
ncbi:uncharacterized protein LOC108000271 isoform X1 [Apis cerana]|uniref:uncharacterized protein LOC108000271 isoform X1 n=2 Tax=Apis cerana TaxID=7461 RepID=UPI00109B8296|nr:uncharacterized protein LOC108000271 isoform X1 [Apis cerana]